MQASADGDSFRVDLAGVRLSDDEKIKLAGAIQGAALSALATFDTGGDQFAVAFPRNGRTQGIWIYDRDLLDERFPDLRKTLEDIRGE